MAVPGRRYGFTWQKACLMGNGQPDEERVGVICSETGDWKDGSKCRIDGTFRIVVFSMPARSTRSSGKALIYL